MAPYPRKNARGFAASGNVVGRFDVKALALAGGLKFDGLALSDRAAAEPVTKPVDEHAGLAGGKPQISNSMTSDGARPASGTTGHDAANAAAVVADIRPVAFESEHRAPGTFGSGAPLSLINSPTIGETVASNLSNDLGALPEATGQGGGPEGVKHLFAMMISVAKTRCPVEGSGHRFYSS